MLRYAVKACSMEEHESTGGYHYHVCIKLNKNERWMPAKQNVSQEHGVSLHLSSAHTNCYSAWKYTTRFHKNFIQSREHPDLNEQRFPEAKAATIKRIHIKVNKNKIVKKNLLAQPEVSSIIRTKQIKTKQQFYALAKTQRKEGKTNLMISSLQKVPKSIRANINANGIAKHSTINCLLIFVVISIVNAAIQNIG